MSWAIEVTGNTEEVGKRFDETRESSASFGMIEDEQRDIDEARDMAMTFAEKYGRVCRQRQRPLELERRGEQLRPLLSDGHESGRGEVMKRRWMSVIALALIVSLGSTGCQTIAKIFGDGDDKEIAASFAEFGAANKVYADDKAAYEGLRATMRAARIARKVPDDTWLDFRISQGIIQSAAPVVDADLATWGATGKKPEMYDAHSKTLRDALAEVAIIAKEFQ